MFSPQLRLNEQEELLYHQALHHCRHRPPSSRLWVGSVHRELCPTHPVWRRAETAQSPTEVERTSVTTYSIQVNGLMITRLPVSTGNRVTFGLCMTMVSPDGNSSRRCHWFVLTAFLYSACVNRQKYTINMLQHQTVH